MAVFLQQLHPMKNLSFWFLSFSAFVILSSCKSMDLKSGLTNKESKIQNVLYFNPEVFPDIKEIKEPTYSAFYSAVSGKMLQYRNYKMLRVDAEIPYDSVDVNSIKEFCYNNNAQFAIVPKVKYFKVGFGKYIFSNQVIVSMKLYDSKGNFVTEADYDTYRKNARILGSAENSIKIGTEGAMKSIARDVLKSRKIL